MLKNLAEGTDRTYVSLDNAMARDLAKSDPVLFFQTYKPPILIDEVQKAPELFEQIKILCDETEEKGMIWLTGSQQYGMMKQVRETLAGRIGILELYSLLQREKNGLITNILFKCGIAFFLVYQIILKALNKFFSDFSHCLTTPLSQFLQNSLCIYFTISTLIKFITHYISIVTQAISLIFIPYSAIIDLSLNLYVNQAVFCESKP